MGACAVGRPVRRPGAASQGNKCPAAVRTAWCFRPTLALGARGEKRREHQLCVAGCRSTQRTKKHATATHWRRVWKGTVPPSKVEDQPLAKPQGYQQSEAKQSEEKEKRQSQGGRRSKKANRFSRKPSGLQPAAPTVCPFASTPCATRKAPFLSVRIPTRSAPRLREAYAVCSAGWGIGVAVPP